MGNARRDWRKWGIACVLGALAGVGLALGCGARSELDQLPPSQAGTDAGVDAAVDAPIDAVDDEAQPDAYDCEAAGDTYVYLMTTERDLYAFDPSAGTVAWRGTINCAGGVSPFSMGVDHLGTAYVIHQNGELYRVSTKDASCEPTDYNPPPVGFDTFGSAFVADEDDSGERLYAADIDHDTETTAGLAWIDPTTTELNFIGPFVGAPGFRIELTASGSELFGFVIDTQGIGGHLIEINRDTAEVTYLESLDIGNNVGAWAFAYWGGDFYFFVNQSGTTSSEVLRYNPDDKQLSLITTIDRRVVGAGVSTCAPR